MTGFSMSFHYVLTLWSIRVGQSDIKKVGIIFSLSFVYLMNVLVTGMLIGSVARGVEPLDFVDNALDRVPDVVKQIGSLVLSIPNMLD